MLVYSTGEKELVETLKQNRWEDTMIMKYLAYRQKRINTVRRGRTAYKDSMQSRVYEAETQYSHNCGEGERFKTIEECDRYVQRITKSKLWKELSGGKSITVSSSAMRRYAGIAYGSHIKLAPSGFNQYTILHELAHCCGNMHHDVSFRQDLLKLVSRFIGRDNAKTLKFAFKTHGLKLSVKQSVKSPEQWLKQYNKMELMRAKR